MASILDFRSEHFFLSIFELQVKLQSFLLRFESAGLSVQKMRKIDFLLDGHHATLDFRQEQFYLLLICQSPRCFLPSFESICPLLQEKKRKTDFLDGQHGGHLGCPKGQF